jgi:hypothetical protein
VQKILQQRSQDGLVLDPFSGTGTTPLTSASLGIPCHGVDINPFLVWLGNLKTKPFGHGVADSVRGIAKDIVAALHTREGASPPWVPNIHAIEKWWDTDILNSLAQLFSRIQEAGDKGESDVVALLKIAFCRVVIQTAHVSFAHQSMSFKKRRRSEQLSLLIDLTASQGTEEVSKAFLTEATAVADTLSSDKPAAKAAVFLGDSRNLREVLPSSNYTTVMTSPPYPNRMSYIRELRPYMYWLGYLTDGRQAGELDWQAIGGTWGCATSLLGKWKPAIDGGIPYAKFDRIITAIGKDHEILSRYVHKYFEDIKRHIDSLRDVLAHGAHCYYVVGNSKFYGTLVPVEWIYAALFEEAGFTNVHIETIRKRTSKKELYEYIIHAEMP